VEVTSFSEGGQTESRLNTRGCNTKQEKMGDYGEDGWAAADKGN